MLKVKVDRPPKTSILTNEEGPASSMSSAYMTRSHNQPLGYHKNKCFFCQNERQGELHACSTYNIGIRMSEIVANCDNPQWKVNYSSVSSENDPLAQDIMYHKQCMTEQWRKYVQKPSQKRKSDESLAGN